MKQTTKKTITIERVEVRSVSITVEVEHDEDQSPEAIQARLEATALDRAGDVDFNSQGKHVSCDYQIS